jgi:hypothetical protein
MHSAGKRILGLALASALSMAVGHAQTAPGLTGFDAAAASAEIELEGRVRQGNPARKPEALARALRSAAASRRIAIRQGQRRLHRGAVHVVGIRHAHRAVRRPVPDAAHAHPRAHRADALHGTAGRAGALRGPDVESGRRAVADLQRVLGERRRDRPARLRQLRRARRLRRTGEARRQRQGRGGHRAVRRIVARDQAEGRRRARRAWLPHLLRPSRGRVLPGRGVPEGARSEASGEPSAAR